MLPKLLLGIVICATVPGVSFSLAQGPQDPGAKSSDQVPAQLPLSPNVAPQREPAKPSLSAKRVYTNDNLPPAGPDSFSGDFSQINDCDRNCFEQVRQLAHVSTGNANWKRDLLHSLDLVRKDANWQQYLRDLYDARLRFCAIGEEKREEIAQVADPRNVTQRELAVDDKYDAKFKQAQASLENLSARQRPLQQNFSYNSFAMQFSQLQVSRIQNVPCAQNRYTASGPNDADDP